MTKLEEIRNRLQDSKNTLNGAGNYWDAIDQLGDLVAYYIEDIEFLLKEIERLNFGNEKVGGAVYTKDIDNFSDDELAPFGELPK